MQILHKNHFSITYSKIKRSELYELLIIFLKHGVISSIYDRLKFEVKKKNIKDFHNLYPLEEQKKLIDSTFKTYLQKNSDKLDEKWQMSFENPFASHGKILKEMNNHLFK